MKPQYRKYFESIGISTETLLAGAEEAIALASRLRADLIESVFVDDFFDEKGLRQYTDMEFITESHLLAITNWQTGGPVIFNIERVETISSLKVTSVEFDFVTAKPGSRLSVDIQTPFGGWGYKAARENCLVLYRLICKHILPRLG